MRVISGTSKGRKLATPGARAFAHLRSGEGITFQHPGKKDRRKASPRSFCWHRNLGIEALSRGAERVLFVEKGKQALGLIQKNLSLCGMEGNLKSFQRT